MESQPRERFRGDDSKSTGLSSGTSLSNLADSNKDQKFIETIPELVSIIFLQYLRDVRMLKICRLVSKSWNICATESLRACSMVCLTEDNAALRDFTKLLLQRAVGHLQDLPSPFKISTQKENHSWTDPTFQSLISITNISITSLGLILDDSEPRLDESQLRLLLTANQTKLENLTILSCSGYEGDSWWDTFLMSDEIKLISLKSLRIEDHCEVCTHVGFMKSFLRMCKPERMDLLFSDGVSMHSLLLEANMENLKQFLLQSDVSLPSWQYLQTLRFSTLRKLILVNPDSSWGDVLPQWDSVCQNVSPFLEELVTDAPLSAGSELKFLNLKTLKVSLNFALSSLTSLVLNSRLLKNSLFTVEIPLSLR